MILFYLLEKVLQLYLCIQIKFDLVLSIVGFLRLSFAFSLSSLLLFILTFVLLARFASKTS